MKEAKREKHPCLRAGVALVLCFERDEGGELKTGEDGGYLLKKMGVDENGNPIYNNREELIESIRQAGRESRAIRVKEIWEEDKIGFGLWLSSLSVEQQGEILNLVRDLV